MGQHDRRAAFVADAGRNDSGPASSVNRAARLPVSDRGRAVRPVSLDGRAVVGQDEVAARDRRGRRRSPRRLTAELEARAASAGSQGTRVSSAALEVVADEADLREADDLAVGRVGERRGRRSAGTATSSNSSKSPGREDVAQVAPQID